jgi:mitochondrial import receptor subunit TOM40
MASTLHTEKVLVDTHVPLSPIPIKSSYFNPLSPFTDAYDRFARWRADLGLPHPGTVENLQKEVKGTFYDRCREKASTHQP